MKPSQYIVVAMLISCSAAVAAVMTPKGLGSIQLGVTKYQLEKMLGHQLDISFDASGDGAGCSEAPVPRVPGAWLMFEDYRLVRIDAENSALRTPEGASVGTTESQLKKLYGERAKFSPHPYLDDQGHYVTVLFPGRKLIFETDRGKVTSFRYGFIGPVDYIEGCA